MARADKRTYDSRGKVDEKHLDDFLGPGSADALRTGAEKSAKFAIPATALATLAGGPVAGLAVAVGTPAYSALYELLYGKIAAKAKDKRDLERFKDAQKEVLRQNNLLVFQNHKGDSKYIGVPKTDFAVSSPSRTIAYLNDPQSKSVKSVVKTANQLSGNSSKSSLQKLARNTPVGATSASHNVARNLAQTGSSTVSKATESKLSNAYNTVKSTAKHLDENVWKPTVTSGGQTLANAIGRGNGLLTTAAGTAIAIGVMPTVRSKVQEANSKLRNSSIGEITHGNVRKYQNQSKYGFSEHDEHHNAFDGYFISDGDPAQNYDVLCQVFRESTMKEYLDSPEIILMTERMSDFFSPLTYSFLEQKSSEFSEGDFGLGTLLGKAAKAVGRAAKSAVDWKLSGTALGGVTGANMRTVNRIASSVGGSAEKAGIGSKLTESFTKPIQETLTKQTADLNKATQDFKNTTAKEGSPEYERQKAVVDKMQARVDKTQQRMDRAEERGTSISETASAAGHLMKSFPGATMTVAKTGKAIMKQQEAKAKQMQQQANSATRADKHYEA